MIPNFTLGNKTISAYMICALIGVFVAGIFTIKQAKKKDQTELLTVLLWAAPGVLIGGSLLYGITNIKLMIKGIAAGIDLLEVFRKCFGGSVFYGALIGGILSSLIYCKIAKIDYRKYTDFAALFIPLFHVFGRIGCFLSGCCFGQECAIGFIYRYSLIEMANHVRRFPIQLVEAAGDLIIFFVLYRLFVRHCCEKRLLSLYFISYAVLRFCTEFFRGDDYRGFVFFLSTSQVISLVMLVLGLVTFFRKKRTLREDLPLSPQ